MSALHHATLLQLLLTVDAAEVENSTHMLSIRWAWFAVTSTLCFTLVIVWHADKENPGPLAGSPTPCNLGLTPVEQSMP